LQPKVVYFTHSLKLTKIISFKSPVLVEERKNSYEVKGFDNVILAQKNENENSP
jgi:hypothetical protein